MSEPWYPENYYIQPAYLMPFVNLEAFRRRRKRYWDAAWTRALQRWAPVGLDLTYDGEWPPGIRVADKVSVEVIDVPPGIGGWAAYYPEPPNPPNYSAFVQIDITTWQNAVKSRNIGDLTKKITHEVGHILGFGHGGNGIMAMVTPAPNDEEIAAARAYWLTA